MKLYPSTTLNIDCALSPVEVMERLRADLRSPATKFRGTVYETSFTIVQKMSVFGTNSFVPQLSGEVSGTETGSTIYIKLALSLGVKKFVVFSGGFASLFASLSILAAIVDSDWTKLQMLYAPFAWFISFYVLSHWAFKIEMPTVKLALLEMLPEGKFIGEAEKKSN